MMHFSRRHRAPSAFASCALLFTANIQTCRALRLSSATTPHLHTRQRLFANMLRATPPHHTDLVSIPRAIEAHASHSPDDASPKNVFIDGSWHMPNNPRNARLEFRTGPRIPRARFFDIDDVASPHPLGLPHMKPSPKRFAAAMDAMDISPQDVLYVYANEGCAFSHRAFWTLRSAGHDPSRVKLVQGSLAEWESCGGKLDYTALEEDDERLFRVSCDGEERTPRYKCLEMEERTVDMDRVLEIVASCPDAREAVVVDARSAGRFYGTEPEPRPGLRGGHIPGSLNVPFLKLLDDTDLTKFRPMDQVRQIFIEAGIEPYEGSGTAKPVICSCGSGVTAAALAVGLEECGLRKREDIYIYDGSWIEWGGNDKTPIVKND